MTTFGKTTAPGAATTADGASEPLLLGLVIACSVAQPHRVGEVALFRKGERLLVGRGAGDVARFAHFVRQLPGQVPAVDPREALLDGESLSRRQLEVHSTGEAIEVAVVGECRTFFNGTRGVRGVLRPGDTIMLRNEVVLLCVARPRELPPLAPGCEPHPFGEPDADGIVGESPAAWRLRDQLARAARGGNHVLIQGDSGTGKELAAAVIHERSSRARQPLVSRNASAFSPALIASELFGNLANYPNHGMQARKGIVGAADKGTLFLDEIGDCPLDVQAQLLRVMDAGEYQLVGDAAVKRVDVRFVGATNKDESSFRSDFLARFLVRIRLPPLRERPEDIALLARHLARQSSELGRFLRAGIDGGLQPRFSPKFVDELLRHPLRLNARELHGILIRAVEASPGDELQWPPMAAPASGPAKANGGPPGIPSRAEVVACLAREDGVVSRAARRLGMKRGALYRLMESYGIEREPKK